MKTKIILLFSLAVLVQSCIPSIHPLYTKEVIVFEESLLGTWANEEGETWLFERGYRESLFSKKTDDSYSLTIEESEESVGYKVFLAKLGDYYFFDFYADYEEYSKFEIAPLIRTHTFGKVELEQGKLKIYLFDGDWLKKLFEQKKIRIKHEILGDGNILLTAPPVDLQKFVIKYGDEEEAFIDPLELTKQKTSE